MDASWERHERQHPATTEANGQSLDSSHIEGFRLNEVGSCGVFSGSQGETRRHQEFQDSLGLYLKWKVS